MLKQTEQRLIKFGIISLATTFNNIKLKSKEEESFSYNIFDFGN